MSNMERCIGVDIGGTNITLGVVEEGRKIICKKSIKTRPARAYSEICADIIYLIRDAIKSYVGIRTVGIGCPGCCDQDKGIVYAANNLGWHDVNLKADIENSAGIDGIMVSVENDANAAAYGEYLAGAARGASSAVVITLGTGVGSGIIFNGEIFHGERFEGGELGHIVIDINGPKCSCGRNGCFETFSSITGLIRMTNEAILNNPGSKIKELAEKAGRISARTAFDAAKSGDEAARAVIESYIRYLACGVANVINIFRPECVCIGGGISNEGENLLAPLRKEVKSQIFAGYSDFETKIVACELNNDAGVIGAAILGCKLNKLN
ncbi:MAG: ROK family protein [Eubacterium sp.]|nr:ROK family protein [Eubacterium sp.]